jgi:hypothetical protein
MESLLNTTAVILVTLWTIGFFAFNAGSVIHILLAIAVISIYLAILQSRRKFEL